MSTRTRKTKEPWYKSSVVYQIYPRSFKDSNGDGIGDLPGIISKLDYLKELGIDVIWLSPVYESPNFDYGYDISNYRKINPEFGTMKDMNDLIKEAKARNIKIIMDLVINHTSSSHEWFKSSMDRNSPYRDYYYWVEKEDLPKNKTKPNNWTGFFSSECWEEYDNAFYLHMFGKEQPDLNFHNPKVIQEVKEIMTFWLKKGIRGFRCDVINIIYKESLEDGRSQLALRGIEHYCSTKGCHQLLKEFRRDVFDKYDCFTVGETVFSDVSGAQDLSDAKRKELDMVFGFEHLEVDNWMFKWFPIKFKPRKLMRVLTKWQRHIEWNANFFENHDQPRLIERFGDPVNYYQESGKLFATLLFGLKGTPFIYEGQEIGMTNAPFTSVSQFKDIELNTFFPLANLLHYSERKMLRVLRARGRENARTPMQWTQEGGFSKGEPWIMMNPNTTNINVRDSEKDPFSILNFYKKLIKLRQQNEVLIYGDFTSILETDYVYIFKRILENKSFIIILNISGHTEVINSMYKGNVLASSYDRLLLNEGKTILRPYESMIVEVD